MSLSWKTMLDSGMLDKNPLTSQTGSLKNNSKKKRTSTKTARGADGAILRYPVARTTAESEDTLLIKAIEYVPPTAGLGEVARNSVNYEKVFTGDLKNSAQTGITAAGNIDPKTGKVSVKFKNAGGMDKRIEELGSKDPAGFQERIKYYVELPIPQQINDSNSVTWGEDSMNVLQAAGAAVAQSLINDPGKTISDTYKLARAAMISGIDFESMGIGPDTATAVQAALAGRALDATGANVTSQSLLGRATGQIVNSNLELLFQGVNLRSFPFNITFSPRNRKEKDVVKGIIKRFKQSMSAKRGANAFGMNGGIFLKPPDVFLLRYLSNGRDHPFLNVFKPCALTNMSTNYTGTGTYSTYSDATPVNIKLSLVFKEINPVYSEDYDDENLAGKGVGF